MRAPYALIYAAVTFTNAAASSTLPPLDAGGVPPACAEVASVPADATIPDPAIAARISLASCEASVKMNALTLTPDDASIRALSNAAKASFDLLDVVIQLHDPFWTPVAQRVRANLLTGMAIRMRNSIAPITMTTVGASLAEHDQAHATLEPKIKAWLDEAK